MKPEALRHSRKVLTKLGLPQDLVPKNFTKAKDVPSIYKASIPDPSHGEPVISSRLHEKEETYHPPNNKVNLVQTGLFLQDQNQVVHHKASVGTCQGLHSYDSTLHLNKGRTRKI